MGEKSYMTEFVDAPEEVNPHVLYQLQEKLEKLGKILVKWQIRQTASDDAMREITLLFPVVLKKAWDENKGRRRRRRRTQP